jgi:hypothetical protein
MLKKIASKESPKECTDFKHNLRHSGNKYTHLVSFFPGGSPEFDTMEEMNVCYLDSPAPLA